MKVIEQEEKQFVPVSLVMENLGELDEVRKILNRTSRCVVIDRAYHELEDIYSQYK